MKHFNILWFEDNIGDFEKIILKLEEHVALHDRLLICEKHDSYPPDFDVMLFDGKYSLAFIDLNLNKGQSGVEIVEILRDKGAFIDILLYSNNPIELIRLTEGKNYVEGIFRHATLKGIQEKMIDVIDQVIYKENMVIIRHESD